MKKKLIDFKKLEVAKSCVAAVKGGTGYNPNAPAGPMNPNAPPNGGGN